MKLDIDVRGLAAQATRIDRMARRVEDPDPLFDRLAGMLEADSRERFAAKGPGWKALDPATIRRKARSSDAETRANARSPMVATGALRDSLTDRAALGAIRDTSVPHELRFGTRLRVANLHDRRRALLKPSADTRRDIRDAIAAYLTGRDS